MSVSDAEKAYYQSILGDTSGKPPPCRAYRRVDHAVDADTPDLDDCQPVG